MSEKLSFTNPKVQRLRRLIGRRSARSDEGVFVVQGEVLIREALAAGWQPEVEFVAPDAEPLTSAASYRLADGVIERVADTTTPQPHMAIFAMPDRVGALDDAAVIVVLDHINDPGNLGTIMRSSEAAGVDAVVITPGSVDPYHPKVVRASAGAIFHLPVVECDIGALVGRFRLIGTSSHAGTSYRQLDWSPPVAIVMGSEAHGLGVGAPIDEWTRIDHRGRAESLNVAMATTLLVFEATTSIRLPTDEV